MGTGNSLFDLILWSELLGGSRRRRKKRKKKVVYVVSAPPPSHTGAGAYPGSGEE